MRTTSLSQSHASKFCSSLRLFHLFSHLTYSNILSQGRQAQKEQYGGNCGMLSQLAALPTERCPPLVASPFVCGEQVEGCVHHLNIPQETMQKQLQSHIGNINETLFRLLCMWCTGKGTIWGELLQLSGQLSLMHRPTGCRNGWNLDQPQRVAW